MRILCIALLSLFTARAGLAQESCTTCHGELGQLESSRVHARAGVSCVSCHGGVPGALTVEEAHAGGVWLPKDGLASVEHCGGCHADSEHMRGFGLRTDQLIDYWISSHGKLLREDPAARTAGCVQCHGAHGILPADDPRAPTHPRNQPQTCGQCHSDAGLMAEREVRADCVELYRDSVHGHALLERGLLSSPACSDCHGSHGAMPPRVEELGRVCGQCHAPAAEAFRAGPHREAARSGAMDECISCHGSHDVHDPGTQMLVGSAAGHCGACHAEGSPARKVGQTLFDVLDGFDRSLAETEQALAQAAAGGVFVEEQLAWLAQARSLRGRATPLVHAVDPAGLTALLEPAQGMLARAHGSLADARRELRDRRIFVAVFALVVLLLAMALLLHAREVARRSTGYTSLRGGEGGA